MHRLEQARLARAVRPDARGRQPGAEGAVERLVAAERGGADALDAHRADQLVASRIGMIRYQKSSSLPLSRPGRSGLISLQHDLVAVHGSMPSRRNSGLKPISSARR